MDEKYAWARVAGDIAEVVLDRPHRHNALVPELLDDLHDAIAHVAAEPAVRVVILRGNGRSFSTGGDVRGFQEADDIAAYSHRLVSRLNDCLLALSRLRTPVVCLVQGLVTGGSLGLILASDVVIMDGGATIPP